MKWVTAIVVMAVCGVGGYFGYGYFKEWQAKKSEGAKAATASVTQEVANAASPEPVPAPKKELPVIPPTWTLDVDQAVTPVAKANGMISGTNFLVTTAHLDKVGTAYLLRLLEGTTASPDRGFMIYLHPSAGENVTNRTWTVSQQARGMTLPQIVELWKTDPRYQARQKVFNYGYAMKLELGEITNGVVPGKIYLAVPPNAEQGVVAGIFNAQTSLADANGATTVNPVMSPNPAAQPGSAPADRSAFERRYGVRR